MLLAELNDLEENYVCFRWTEARIRRTYYEKIWKARREQNDPLSKEGREAGRREEENLRRMLASLEDKSKQSSNGFIEKIRSLQNGDKRLAVCCREKGYEECIQKSYQPFYQLLEEAEKRFGPIFEHEREYRKAVKLTAGDTEGLYPRDTLEEKRAHKDYYERFELERSPARFQEDAEMINFFHEAHEKLTVNFPPENCCYHCGPQDWDKKIEKLF